MTWISPSYLRFESLALAYAQGTNISYMAMDVGIPDELSARTAVVQQRVVRRLGWGAGIGVHVCIGVG